MSTKSQIQLFLFLIGLLGLISCGGGGDGSGSDNWTPSEGSSSVHSKVRSTIQVHGELRSNTNVSLSVAGNQPDNVSWSVTAPQGTAVPLTSTGANRVEFVPYSPGEHQIMAELVWPSRTDQKVLQIEIFEAKSAFAESSMDKEDPNAPASRTRGLIRDQVWLWSSNVTEDALRAVAAERGWQVIAWDEDMGLLAQSAEAEEQFLQSIRDVRRDPRVTMATRRFVEGKDAPPAIELVPNDDAGGFNDDRGPNWHHEVINSPEAWDLQTGSDQFIISVIDDGFFVGHEDLEETDAATGETRSRVVSELGWGTPAAHGTASLGTVGAVQDNGLGSAGMNWVTRILALDQDVLGGYRSSLVFHDNDLRVRIATASIGVAGHIPADFDPEDTNVTDARQERAEAALARLRTGQLRQIENNRTDILLLLSAGNGIDNGQDGVLARYANGAIHFQDKSFDPLPNTLIVGAVDMDFDANGNPENTFSLARYSNYGDEVDIAAPTRFLATNGVTQNGVSTYNSDSMCVDDIAEPDPLSSCGEHDAQNCVNAVDQNNTQCRLITREYGRNGGYGGTSAATPVVAGAASLVLSENLNLTAADVKKILIDTAQSTITERHTNGLNRQTAAIPAGAGIPLLDAAAAVALASDFPGGPRHIRFATSTITENEPVQVTVFKGRDSDNNFLGGECWATNTSNTQTNPVRYTDSQIAVTQFDLEFTAAGTAHVFCRSVDDGNNHSATVFRNVEVQPSEEPICEANSIDTRSCSVPNGSGTRSRQCAADGSSYGEFGNCTATSCNSGYQLSNGQCELQQNTVCQANSIDTRSCSVPNGSGTRSRQCAADGNSYGSFGSCTANSCDSGYQLSNGQCQQQRNTVCQANSIDTRSCSVPNGSGTRSRQCAADGNSYGGFGSCTANSCDSGYRLSGGQCVADFERTVQENRSNMSCTGAEYFWRVNGYGDGGMEYTYAIDSAAPECHSKWFMPTNGPGTYDVWAYIPDDSYDNTPATENARYKIFRDEIGSSFVQINQRFPTCGSRGECWVHLGAFSYVSGQFIVWLDDNTGEAFNGLNSSRSHQVMFDSIRIKKK
ncbi:MAG: S8 family serine peptidase [Pseudomonadota bacterium]